jgi:DNA adenine methylase
VKQPLKWHGGKHYLASQIVALMPPHTHYVEPYAGGLAVLLAKLCEGISEVVNDLNADLTNFWHVLQDEALFRKLQRRVQAVPFSEVEWHEAKRLVDKMSTGSSNRQPVERAVAFFILCRQSLAGRCKVFAPLSRNRTRRGMNEQASAWLAAIEGLPEVHQRLRRVVVLNQPAVDVIRSQDGPDTLFYLDPPYLPDTKASQAFGPLEMTSEQHEQLLDVIVGVRGKVMISGYASKLYDTRLSGWSRNEFRIANSAASGVMKRDMTEVVWCNFQPNPVTRQGVDATDRSADRPDPLPV